MAISPLDLQTLFTQMDMVGRQEAAQKDGAAVIQSMQHARIQQQTDEKIRSVNEAQNSGDGTEAINDENGGRAGQEGSRKEHSGETEEKESANDGIIRDPNLGRNIDFSL